MNDMNDRPDRDSNPQPLAYQVIQTPKTAVKLCLAQTLCPVVPHIQDSLQRL